MASNLNANFVPDNVYVELLYKGPDGSFVEKIAKPFRTPAAIHKAVFLEFPDYRLVDIETSETFQKWLKEEGLQDRDRLARTEWYDRVESLPLTSEVKQTTIKIVDGYPIPVEVNTPETINDLKLEQASILQQIGHRILTDGECVIDSSGNVKSYAEAFKKSEEKAIEKAIQEHPEAFSANSKQHGGTHYKTLAIQPWDYIVANNIPYLEGSAIKYITRWKDKGGIEDLKKAIHFIEKLIEVEQARDNTSS